LVILFYFGYFDYFGLFWLFWLFWFILIILVILVIPFGFLSLKYLLIIGILNVLHEGYSRNSWCALI
jgi:hypothetical protein